MNRHIVGPGFRRTFALLCIALAALLVPLGTNAAGRVLFVSEAGDDANPGTKARPFRTLERARDAIRSSPRDARATDPVTVMIRAGQYRFTQPLLLEAQDSGTTEAPVVYRAFESETAVLSGALDPQSVRRAAEVAGLANPGFDEEVWRNIRVVDLKANGAEEAIPEKSYRQQKTGDKDSAGPVELILGDRIATLARSPNEGWFNGEVRGVEDSRKDPGTAKLRLNAPVNGGWMDGSALVRGYFKWDWYDETIRAVVSDAGGPELALEARPVYGFGRRSRIRLMNQASALDRPGEYYLDFAAQRVYFLDRGPGNERVRITQSVSPLVVLRAAAYVRFEGLLFEGGRGNAVEIGDSKGVIIERCGVRSFGRAGIVVKGGSGVRILRSTFEDLGTNGVSVTGGDRATLEPSKHEVADNVFARTGRLISAGFPAVFIGGVGVTVSRNEIRELAHAGIVLSGNDHVVEFNEVSEVCREASDCGAIYLGRDWTSQGNVVRYNYVHDMSGAYRGADTVGTYLDDLASNVSVVGNVYRGVNRGVLVGGGRDNRIVNNYFDSVHIPVSVDSRGTHWAARFMDTDGALTQKLKQVPYKSERWRGKYPNLAGIMEDEPGLPKRNVVRNNMAVNSGDFTFDPVARMVGSFSANENTRSSSGRIPDSAAIKQVIRYWEPIPVEKIRGLTQ